MFNYQMLENMQHRHR